MNDADELVAVLRSFRPSELGDLMGISEKLADLNHARFSDWEKPHPKSGSKAAVFAFQGDVYRGLQANQWTSNQVAEAQLRLRILSGLYGVLRPLDRILPYRLEMGTRLENDRGKDLYEYWGDKVASKLRQDMQATKSKFLLNLASVEYFKSVQGGGFEQPVISPVFKEFKNGKYKIISLFAKVARGNMASWVIRKRVKSISKLIQFDEDGYRYDCESSTDSKPVFLRGG
jgi:cytoplasmic iron level regulating protein YaaA (DUF328/UPF0246 family)